MNPTPLAHFTLNTHATASRRQRGFTLIDFMIVLTILGILLGQAAPSWSRAFADKKLVGEAESIATAIRYARSHTVSRNEGISFSVLGTPTGASCHVVHTGQARDCRCNNEGIATCAAPALALSSSRVDDAVRATLGTSIRFDPRNGTATPTGTVTVRSVATGQEIQNRVAITGRIRTCTSATTSLPGVPPCPR